MGDQQSRQEEEGVSFGEEEGSTPAKQRTILSKAAKLARTVVDADAKDISNALASRTQAKVQQAKEERERRKELKGRDAAEASGSVGPEGEREAVPADWWSGEAVKNHGDELGEDARADEEEVAVSSGRPQKGPRDPKFNKAWTAITTYQAVASDMPNWARPGVERPIKAEEGGDIKRKGAKSSKKGGKDKGSSANAAPKAAPVAEVDPWADDDDDDDAPGVVAVPKAKAKAPASARSNAAAKNDPWGDDSDDGPSVPVAQPKNRASLRSSPVAVPRSVAKDDPWGDDSDGPCTDPVPVAIPKSSGNKPKAAAGDPWGDDDEDPGSGGVVAAKAKAKKKTKRHGSLTGDASKKKATENGGGAPRKAGKSPRPKGGSGSKKASPGPAPAPKAATGGAGDDDDDDDVMF